MLFQESKKKNKYFEKLTENESSCKIKAEMN